MPQGAPNLKSPPAAGRAPEACAFTEPVDARLVALMRLILASSALAAVYIDPPEPGRLVRLTYAALALYTLFGALLYLLSVRRPDSAHARRVHWLDVAWYVLFISLSGGTSSIFFLLFFFAALVASFRFGFAEGLRVTLVSASLFTLFGYLTAPGGQGFELNRFLLRPVYLVALGYMIAYWGGRELTFKRRLGFLKEVSRLSNPRFGVDQTVCSIMERVRAFYGADACLLVLPDAGSADYLVRRAVREDAERALRPERVPPECVCPLLSPPAEQVVVFNRRTKRHPFATRYRTFPAGPDAAGLDVNFAGEAAALSDLLGGSYVSIPLRTRDLTPGRFYLVRAGGAFGGSDVDFLRQVAEQVQPVVENIQLLDNLATEAAEQERRRISRDIHDSTIQPYVGLRLALESLRRRTPVGEPLAAELDELIKMADEEIKDLRRYAEGLRVGSRGDDALVPAIRRQAEKFSSIYGIPVEVRAEEDVRVGDRLAAEVFQLVREGLSNVRRHTEASRAVVSLSRTETHLRVRIENDGARPNGRHAPFVPRSISERAASVGGRASVQTNGDGRTTVAVEIPT